MFCIVAPSRRLNYFRSRLNLLPTMTREGNSVFDAFHLVETYDGSLMKSDLPNGVAHYVNPLCGLRLIGPQSTPASIVQSTMLRWRTWFICDMCSPDMPLLKPRSFSGRIRRLKGSGHLSHGTRLTV